jgi:hypothetical protein
VLRHGEPLTSHGDRCRSGSDRQHSRRPRGADIFLPPPYATDSSTETRFPHSVAWRASWRHCCCPMMSASSANTSAHVLYPVPLPAVDAEDGHHACHPCGQQRERIERALAHPQRAVTLRQRGGILRCRRKVSPRLARQGGLEHSELVGEVWTHWSGLTRCGGICGELPACCWRPGKPLWQLATMRYALPTGWRSPEGRLGFLFFAPPRMRCFHIAPGAAGKTGETAGSRRDGYAPLVARAVEGT